MEQKMTRIHTNKLTNSQLAAGLLVGMQSEKYRNSDYFQDILREAAKRLFPESKPRKSLYYPSGDLYQFTLDSRCACGCNVFHWENCEGNIYAVCNACGDTIGILKEPQELPECGVWRE